MSVKRKTYLKLYEEREAVIDEIEELKLSGFIGSRMGLWTSSTYIDELLYIRNTIEIEMISHQIVTRMKLYKSLETKFNLPDDLISHITLFGDFIDQSASSFIRQRVEDNIEYINQFCKQQHTFHLFLNKFHHSLDNYL